MVQANVKTFHDLEQEVIGEELCGKCGGCVSFCSADGLNALELGEDGLPRFADEDKCLECGICYAICPETKELDQEVRSRFGWKPPIGTCKAVTSSRAADAAVREVATDGGVVTSLLLYLLDRHLIDGAIVSRRDSLLSREPVIARMRDELIAAAGSNFAGSCHLGELPQYTTYSPTVGYVKRLTEGYRCVAMVGTPCQIRTIRKMQCLGILPADVIRYTIGLFCTENLLFDAQGRQELEQRLHFDFADVVKMNVKESFILTLASGRTIRIPFDDLDDLAHPSSLVCTEFANDYADLAAGGLGSPDGYTTVLVRTDTGRAVYDDALRRGYIEERVLSGGAGPRREREQMMSKVVEFARWKRERGEAHRRELGVALKELV
jgi:coenzyme F420 hydrogenase subunit beta